MEDESTESAKARTLSQQLHKRNQRQKNRRKKRAAKRNEGEEEQPSLGEQPSDEMVTDCPSTDDAGTSCDAVETDHVNKTGSTDVNQFEAKNILNSEDSSKICETGDNTEIKIESDKSMSNADATLQCLNEFSMNAEVTSQYLSKPSTTVTARKAEGVTTLKTDGPIVITPSQGKSTVPYNWLDCTMPLDDEDLCSSTKSVLADQTTTAVALPVVGNDTADTLPVVESDTADTPPVNTTNTTDTLPAEGSSIADKLPVGEANITNTVSDGEANTADTVSVDEANSADTVSGGEANSADTVSVDEANSADTVSGGEANTADTVSVDEGNDADIIPVGEANTAEALAVGVADTAATFAVDETNTGDESAVGEHNIPEASTVHEANTADTLPVSVARTTDTLAVGKTTVTTYTKLISKTSVPDALPVSKATPNAGNMMHTEETRSIVVDTIIIDDNTAANKLQTDKSGSTVKNTITIVDSDDEVEETGSSTQSANSASNLNKESLNTPDLVEMENSRVNPVTTENTTKEKKDKDDGDTAQPITKDLFRLSTRVQEFELALRDKDQVIASLKERISKHQEQQRQEKEVMKERKKLIEDMNSLTEHNQRLEAEISKLKKEREQYPKMPSQNFRTAIVNQVDQCKKLVAALQEELDACKKKSSNQSKTSSSSETLKRKTPNEQLTTSGKKQRQEVVPAYVVWRLQLKNHRGVPGNVNIQSNHAVKFGGLFSTVSAPAVVIPRGKKAWYEVQYTHIGSKGKGCKQVVGWATPELSKDDNVTQFGLGDTKDSMGYDPFHGYKYHGKNERWGNRLATWGGRGGYVGVAVDMVKGSVYFSLNGVWMGVAFGGIPTYKRLFPAFSSCDATLQVNFGDKEFTYGPPDATFQGLAHAIA